MIQLAIVGIVAALLLGGGGVWLHSYGSQRFDAGKAECHAETEKAQNELAAQAKARVDEAENHITDMQAAFEVGESKAKTRVVTVVQRAQADVAAGKIPVCSLPPDSLRTLNLARAGVRKAVDEEVPAQAPTPMPAPASAAPPQRAPAASIPAAPTATPPRPLGKRP